MKDNEVSEILVMIAAILTPLLLIPVNPPLSFALIGILLVVLVSIYYGHKHYQHSHQTTNDDVPIEN